jgi:hypothetical protein
VLNVQYEKFVNKRHKTLRVLGYISVHATAKGLEDYNKEEAGLVDLLNDRKIIQQLI